MKSARRAVCILTAAVLVCMLLTTAVFAAEDGKVWLKLTETSDGKGAAALIVTDTTVTDGVVTVTYDADELTYQNVEVTESYVAMYSVNAEEKGVVRISWVAPEAYKADGSDLDLIRVNFSGKADEDSVALSGTAFDEEGAQVSISTEVEIVGTTGGANNGSANTGDDSMVMFAAVLMMAAAMGMWAVNKRRYAR